MATVALFGVVLFCGALLFCGVLFGNRLSRGRARRRIVRKSRHNTFAVLMILGFIALCVSIFLNGCGAGELAGAFGFVPLARRKRKDLSRERFSGLDERSAHFEKLTEDTPEPPEGINWRAFIFWFLSSLILPAHMMQYHAYVAFRRNRGQTDAARRAFGLALAFTVMGVALWVGIVHRLNREKVVFNTKTVFVFYVPINFAMNVFSFVRFAIPNYRSFPLRFNRARKKIFVQNATHQIHGFDIIDKVKAAGWNLNFFECNERIPASEFPDPSPESFCIGTDGSNYIMYSFNSELCETDICIMGGPGTGKRNILRGLLFGAQEEEGCHIAICDGNPHAGFDLYNIGIKAAYVEGMAICEKIIEQIAQTLAQRVRTGQPGPRVVLVIDESISKNLKTRENEKLADNLGDIISKGTPFKVHVIAVLGHTSEDFRIAEMLQRAFGFARFDTYYNFKFKAKDKNEKDTVATPHSHPFFDVVAVNVNGVPKVIKAAFYEKGYRS
jgi:hypothetical protein